MSKLLQSIVTTITQKRHVVLSSVPDGFDAIVTADLARGIAKQGQGKAAALVFVARDGQRQAAMEATLGIAKQFYYVSAYDGFSSTGTIPDE